MANSVNHLQINTSFEKYTPLLATELYFICPELGCLTKIPHRNEVVVAAVLHPTGEFWLLEVRSP